MRQLTIRHKNATSLVFAKEEMLDTLDCYCDDQIERYKKLQEQLENLRKG